MPLDQETRRSLGLGQCLELDIQPLTVIDPNEVTDEDENFSDEDFMSRIWLDCERKAAEEAWNE